MNENISFRNLKTIIKMKGMTMKEISALFGEGKSINISNICTGKSTPLTSAIAKICSILKVYPSEIVSFDDIEVNEELFPRSKRDPLPLEFTGEVTYKPFWIFLAKYIEDWNKTHESKIDHNDIFNQIKSYRKEMVTEEQRLKFQEASKKAVKARFGEDYVAKYKNHYDYSNGLSLSTRTKLRNDRPLNIATIHEICKYFSCPIDYVMSYK